MCFHSIMLGNKLSWAAQLHGESGVIAHHISGCLAQRSLADNKRDITLYITTLGSRKHNKSRAKKIKHTAQMEEQRRGNTGVKPGLPLDPGGREETWCVAR